MIIHAGIAGHSTNDSPGNDAIERLANQVGSSKPVGQRRCIFCDVSIFEITKPAGNPAGGVGQQGAPGGYLEKFTPVPSEPIETRVPGNARNFGVNSGYFQEIDNFRLLPGRGWKSDFYVSTICP